MGNYLVGIITIIDIETEESINTGPMGFFKDYESLKTFISNNFKINPITIYTIENNELKKKNDDYFDYPVIVYVEINNKLKPFKQNKNKKKNREIKFLFYFVIKQKNFINFIHTK
jgi:hypothetical protein